jgi:hypothetical protein
VWAFKGQGDPVTQPTDFLASLCQNEVGFFYFLSLTLRKGDEITVEDYLSYKNT